MQISVVAHNIRSAHNVGSLFRSCDGFGVAHLYLSGYTPYPLQDMDGRLPHISQKLHRQIHKTALGAETMVPFSYHEDIGQLLAGLSTTHTLAALEQSEDSIPLPLFDNGSTEHIALLLGEEVHGIAEDLRRYCSATLEIPMYGRKESFNVAVAAAIALYSLKERPVMLQFERQH